LIDVYKIWVNIGVLLICIAGLNAYIPNGNTGWYNIIYIDKALTDTIPQKITEIGRSSRSQEICGSGMDDDGDGLVDWFDPDCPCDNQLFQAQCLDSCTRIQSDSSEIKLKLKWVSEVLSDIDNASTLFSPNFISIPTYNLIATPTKVLKDDNTINGLAFIDLNSGQIIRRAIVDTLSSTAAVLISGYVDADRSLNIFWSDYNRLYKYNFEGDSVQNINTLIHNPVYNPGSIGISDFNHSGIPLMYLGDKIFNAETGSLLLSGNGSLGCNGHFFNNCPYGAVSIAADLTDHPGLELACGNMVYEVHIENYNDTIGNYVNTIVAPPRLKDGFTSIADIDGDGLLDVVVVRDNQFLDGGVWVWNPRTGSLIAEGFTVARGGIATIADVLGDCRPEIFVVYRNEMVLFEYDGTNILKRVYRKTLSENSGITACTVFDLNGDGRKEVIVRDEQFLYILDAPTGITLDSMELLSGTWLEYPIIVDVDGDGHAEILVSGYVEDRQALQIFCFESAGSPWAPARSVWNQYGYHVTNVNDDMTIPRQMQSGAVPLQGTENCPQEECSTPYNNFMVQATYRTQAGCRVWPSKDEDLYVTEAQAVCTQDSIELCISIHYKEENALNTGVKVQVFPVSSGVSATEALIHHVTHSAEVCFYLPKDISAEELLIVLNSSSDLYPPQYTDTDITECNYDNNSYTVRVPDFDLYIEAIRWECTPDSLIFYVLAGVIGTGYEDRCHDIICYFEDPHTGEGIPLEFTSWCVDTLQVEVDASYTDTLRFAMPLPYGESRMYFTINDTGLGPGWDASLFTGVYECDYSNNITHFDLDIEPMVLDLGADIQKCETEVFTLDAGVGFVSYVWSDFSNDRIYSSAEAGIHTVEATDHCGRIYRDTVEVVIDRSMDADLGPDRILCPDEPLSLSTSSPYETIQWIVADTVVCDGCPHFEIELIDSLLVSVLLQNGGCLSRDSVWLYRLEADTMSNMATLCYGEEVSFGSETLSESGEYIRSVNGCEQYERLLLTVHEDASEEISLSLCSGDSIWVADRWVTESGVFSELFIDENACEAERIYYVEEVELWLEERSYEICRGDSIEINGVWYDDSVEFTHTIQSQSGCDSTIIHTLVVFDAPETYLSEEICSGSVLEISGVSYSESGLYTQYISTGAVCDSILRIELLVLPPLKIENLVELCAGDTIEIAGMAISESMTLELHYQTDAGCDSLETWDIKVADYEREVMMTHKCVGDSVEIHGTLYYNTGMYVDTVRVDRCLVIRSLTIEEVALEEIYEMKYLCPGDSLIIAGEIVRESTVWTERIPAAEGCDTLKRIEVLALELPEGNTEIDCETQSIEVYLSGSTDNWQIVWDNGTEGPSSRYYGGGQAVVSLNYDGDCDREMQIQLPLVPNIENIPALQDTVIEAGSVLSLSLGVDLSEWTVQWSPSHAVDCADCSTVQIESTESREIIVTLKHESGCEYTYRFRIEVDRIEDIRVPNVIAPERGGENSIWKIYTTEGIEVEEVYIYDRWGSVMHHIKAGSPVQWDGRRDGRDVVPGVYVYQIIYRNAQNLQKVLTGDVTVVR
jgi:gliding motility-associated-like protein